VSHALGYLRDLRTFSFLPFGVVCGRSNQTSTPGPFEAYETEEIFSG
jgi:hypothetical protein